MNQVFQTPLIEMRGIVKTYNVGKENELEILHGIDLTVYPGEFVAIVGESGSGKSTLMNIIGAVSYTHLDVYKRQPPEWPQYHPESPPASDQQTWQCLQQ